MVLPRNVAQALLPVPAISGRKLMGLNIARRIETEKAVWSEATYKGHMGGESGAPNTRDFRVVGWEARIAEPPASGQRIFQDIDTAKAVWSEATYKGL